MGLDSVVCWLRLGWPLLEFHDLSTPVVKDFSYLGQAFLTLLVEPCPFIEITLIRIELLNDFFDTGQPVVNLLVVCHAQITPNQSPVIANNSNNSTAIAAL
jgi:hypothetical protein